jgi:peptide/nickel transport system ATP-binding protein
MSSNGKLLEVRNLRTYFETEDGTVKAVDGISFALERGETLGIVGESGSGKSVTNLSVIRLIPSPPGKIVSGEIIFDGQDILALSAEELRKIRGRRIAMIFQDPMTSLNPFMKISRQLMEITQLHLGYDKSQAYEHAINMLETVGIPDARARANNYPHEFSGGMRQRVMIAMALSCRPELLIADEPTTALDVTIQAQILDLLGELKEKMGMAVMLITHAMGVIAETAQRVAVMYAGKVVEEASVQDLFAAPRHPYTQGLIRSIPRIDLAAVQKRRLEAIPGVVPSLLEPAPGCRFAPRCPHVRAECTVETPPLLEVWPGHKVACVLWKQAA